MVGVDALELAERLDLNELASDAITTLSQLKKAGPKEGLRAALIEAVARAEKSGALNAELRGPLAARPLLPGLGGVRRDREVVHSAPSSAARRPGIPWAPYAFESRWQLDLVALTRGRVGPRPRARPTCPGRRRRCPRALLDSVRVTASTSAAARTSPAELPDLRRYWHKEGGVAISSAGLEMVLAGRRNDPAAVLAVYESVGRRDDRTIWHPWFSARIRLAAVGDRRPRRRRPVDARPPSGRRTSRSAERLLPRRAHRARAVHRPVGLLGARGPGLGQAAGRRAAADALAVRRRRRRRPTCSSTSGARPS